MEDVKVCRICFAMDVKMFDLLSYPFDSYFESITGSKLLPVFNSATYACYECAALIKKYYFFKQKCLKSQATLFGLLDGNGKITTARLKQINRQNLLSSKTLPAYSVPYQISENLTTVIKEESKVEDSQSDIAVNVACVKEEEECEVASQEGDLPVHDDDEPLPIHKIEKQENVDREYQDDLEIEPSETAEVPDNPPPKKRKQDLSNDDPGDNVTTIYYTLEEQLEEINKRKQSAEYLNSPLQCPLCFQGFTIMDNWVNHIVKHSPEAGDFECLICKFRFRTKIEMQKHLFHHKKRYQCKICSHISSNMPQARRHQNEHKIAGYKCKYCGEVLINYMKYVNHSCEKQHQPSDFKCVLCGYSCISMTGLQRHNTVKHRADWEKGVVIPEDGPHCEDCQVKFATAEAYERHLVTSIRHKQMPPARHQSNKDEGVRYKCKYCGEVFIDFMKYVVHLRTKQHQLSDFVCAVCGYSCISKVGLERHNAHMHKDIAETAEVSPEDGESTGITYCEDCEVKFVSTEAYKRHLKTSIRHTKDIYLGTPPDSAVEEARAQRTAARCPPAPWRFTDDEMRDNSLCSL